MVHNSCLKSQLRIRFLHTLRLPVYQGPIPSYVMPLLILLDTPEFACPERYYGQANGYSGRSIDFVQNIFSKCSSMMTVLICLITKLFMTYYTSYLNSLFIFHLLGECHCWWTNESPRAHVAKFYDQLRSIRSI